jgi:4-hydroxythreonine-4-phosphate dehydrogenase
MLLSLRDCFLKRMKPAPIALTMGEPAGIGGEIALKAWATRNNTSPPFFIIDNAQRLTALAKALGIAASVKAISSPHETAAVWSKALPVLDLPEAADITPVPGKPDPATAKAVIASIATGVKLAQAHQASAVVTNPIQKATLQADGFAFPGHTEFLGHLAGGVDTVMMLAAERPDPPLRVVPVTVHTPIAKVPATLTIDGILRRGRITARALRRDFGIPNPRLAVTGLNPHAGEDGTIGEEDIRIIAPAIAQLRAEGLDARGPVPADTLFHGEARRTYDAALCMYHDQALVPLKTLDFAGGVNVTLGLDFVRTSPDHGTALDIAGKGVADPTSLIAALELAARIAARRG